MNKILTSDVAGEIVEELSDFDVTAKFYPISYEQEQFVMDTLDDVNNNNPQNNDTFVIYTFENDPEYEDYIKNVGVASPEFDIDPDWDAVDMPPLEGDSTLTEPKPQPEPILLQPWEENPDDYYFQNGQYKLQSEIEANPFYQDCADGSTQQSMRNDLVWAGDRWELQDPCWDHGGRFQDLIDVEGKQQIFDDSPMGQSLLQNYIAQFGFPKFIILEIIPKNDNVSSSPRAFQTIVLRKPEFSQILSEWNKLPIKEVALKNNTRNQIYKIDYTTLAYIVKDMINREPSMPYTAEIAGYS
jgi:hypothetical protein